METCPICQKHKGLGELPQPPGGYIYADDQWKVCHAPANLGPLGTLFIESTRHFLDYSEFNEPEQASYGVLAQRVSAALKRLTPAERVYHLSTVEGVPHFHVWLVPRTKNMAEHGLKFLARDDSCDEPDAIGLANRLRAVLETPISNRKS